VAGRLLLLMSALALASEPAAGQGRGAADSIQRPGTAAWALTGSDRTGYVLDAAGWVTGADGATLTLRSTSAAGKGFGAATGRLRADTLIRRRVRISAEITTIDVVGSASLWIRADGGMQTVAFDNGADQALQGTTGPRHMDLTVSVPNAATTLTFGLLLNGTGQATARNVRIEAGPIIATNTPLAVEALGELDSALGIVRRSSLWRDTVTWSRVEPDVRAIAGGAQTAGDVYPAIRYLLAHLGDHHSSFITPQGAHALRTGGAGNPQAVVRVQTAGVGYVSVPAYSGTEPSAIVAYARAMQDSLTATVANGARACRWIVDLRQNLGGNMWPMIAGLRPFLGNDGLGTFVSPAGSQPLWHARDGADIAPASELVPLESAWVAVLTGPKTASSGEATAIAFRGRPRTRSFGLPTAGLSTANSGFPLPDGAMIILTTAVDADRTGTRYGGKIEPDEVIPAAASGGPDDPQLARAIAWLQSVPGCGAQ
jgi:carboxyl-terminal processing protease